MQSFDMNLVETFLLIGGVLYKHNGTGTEFQSPKDELSLTPVKSA